MVLKLTDDDVARIRSLYQDGERQKDLAAAFGVSRPTISMVVNGRLHTEPRPNNRSPKGFIGELGRECSQCGAYKVWGEFSATTASKTGHQSSCMDCRRSAYSGPPKGFGIEDFRDRRRWAYIKCKYGITQEQYGWLSERQDHECALCGLPEKPRSRTDKNGRSWITECLGIDHCHSCPFHAPQKACMRCIRGLLCDNCNRLLGFAELKPLVAVRFADYLVLRPFLDGGEVMLNGDDIC